MSNSEFVIDVNNENSAEHSWHWAVKVTRYVYEKCGFTEEWIDDQWDIDKLAKKYDKE